MAASCSNDRTLLWLIDAAPEPASAVEDAGSTGDAHVAHDAAPVDAAPLPVVCTSPPCAMSLVTTLGYSADDEEGFCVRLQDETVACWGSNRYGQLGRGAEAGTLASLTPARVVGLTEVVALDHTSALDKSGAIWGWGVGPYLRSDASPSTVEFTPVKLPIPAATAMGRGVDTACAVVDGGALCWGKNWYRQVSASWTNFEPLPRAVAIPPGAPIRDLYVSSASFAFREDGTVVSWGANPPLARVSSLFPDPYPQPVDLAGISMMDLADNNACAVAGGIAYCWGAAFGLSAVSRALPEPVVTPEPVVQVSTTATAATLDGTVSQPQRWCACGASGSLYCWGYNATGQVGDGTKEYAFKAVKVGLPAPAAQVKTTLNTTCALLTNGKVYCWGSNYYGQLGSGQLKVPSLVPQEVALP